MTVRAIHESPLPLRPFDVAQDMLGERNFRVRELSTAAIFEPRARYDKHVGVSFGIAMQRAQKRIGIRRGGFVTRPLGVGASANMREPRREREEINRGNPCVGAYRIRPGVVARRSRGNPICADDAKSKSREVKSEQLWRKDE